MPRKPSVIVSVADKKDQIASIKRELKAAKTRVRDHDREAKRIERETAQLLKAVDRKRTLAAKDAEKLEQRLSAYVA